RARIVELGVSTELLRATQTLIVLPLDGTARSRSAVDAAIDEVCCADEGGRGEVAGGSFLFLPGIDRVTMVDHVRRFRAELEKRDTAPPEDIGQGTTLRHLRSVQTVYNLDRPEVPTDPKLQDWFAVERVIGDGDDERAARERDAIRDAIRALHLPEENWKGI